MQSIAIFICLVGLTAWATEPVAVWRFEGCDDSTVTLKGCRVVDETGRGQVLLFSRSSDRAFATVADGLPSLTTTDRPFTVSIRIKPEKGLVSTSMLEMAKMCNSRRMDKFFAALNDGKWHRIVVTFDPKRKNREYALFLDWDNSSSSCRFFSEYDKGERVSKCVLPFSLKKGKATFGGSVGWSMFTVDYRGMIDDVEIYQSALPADSFACP